jgi:hypothetical protein
MTDIVKKEKKVQTPERLEQLARARAKALEIRKAGAVIKMEAKIASITDPGFTPTPPNEIENKIQRAELVDNPVTQEFVPEYSPRVEVKPPVLNGNLLKDEFHPHEHVIFVKRKSKNDSKAKTIPAATPPPPTSPVRAHRESMPLHPQQELRQLPTFPLVNTMDDFINAGFSNYRKYY